MRKGYSCALTDQVSVNAMKGDVLVTARIAAIMARSAPRTEKTDPPAVPPLALSKVDSRHCGPTTTSRMHRPRHRQGHWTHRGENGGADRIVVACLTIN